jgi:hypothetical protein
MPLFYSPLTRPADYRRKKPAQPCEAFQRNGWVVSNDQPYAGSAIEHPTGNIDSSHSAANHKFHAQARLRTSLNWLHQLNPLAHPRVPIIVNDELSILLSLSLSCTITNVDIPPSTTSHPLPLKTNYPNSTKQLDCPKFAKHLNRSGVGGFEIDEDNRSIDRGI